MQCDHETLFHFLRFPGDSLTSASTPVCSTKEQILKTEKFYIDLTVKKDFEVVEATDCPLPCSYHEYKLVGKPQKVGGSGFGFILKYARTFGREERQSLLYDFQSFVSEFGGALGLFLGFSFLSCLDLFQGIFVSLKNKRFIFLIII